MIAHFKVIFNVIRVVVVVRKADSRLYGPGLLNGTIPRLFVHPFILFQHANQRFFYLLNDFSDLKLKFKFLLLVSFFFYTKCLFFVLYFGFNLGIEFVLHVDSTDLGENRIDGHCVAVEHSIGQFSDTITYL